MQPQRRPLEAARLGLSILEFYWVGLLPRLGPRWYWWFRYREEDPWQYTASVYEQRKYERTLQSAPLAGATRILEVGCSEGLFTTLLADRCDGATIVAVDLAAQAVARAKLRCRRSNVDFRCLDVCALEEPGGFDLVFCAETLSYCGTYRRLERYAESLASLLAPDGYLVLVNAVPQASFLFRPFRLNPRLAVVEDHHQNDPSRPYRICVLRRVPEDASGLSPDRAI